MFKSKAGNFSSDYSRGDLMRDIGLPQIVKEDVKTEVEDHEKIVKIQEVKFTEDQSERPPSQSSSLMGLNDADDEFFDVPEPTDYDQLENWSSELIPELHAAVLHLI